MALPTIIGAAVETAFTYAKQELLAPGGAAAGALLADYIAKRVNQSRQVVLSELERLGATADDFKDAEQFAAAAFRFTRATRDQTADENLRLLAQAMVGLARREKLWASEFLKYADILSNLSRDEIILIGALMSEDEKFHAVARPENSEARVWQLTKIAVVSHPYGLPSEDYAQAVAGRAMRSGLVVSIPGFDGVFYGLSVIGREARQFVNIQIALNPYWQSVRQD